MVDTNDATMVSHTAHPQTQHVGTPPPAYTLTQGFTGRRGKARRKRRGQLGSASAITACRPWSQPPSGCALRAPCARAPCSRNHKRALPRTGAARHGQRARGRARERHSTSARNGSAHTPAHTRTFPQKTYEQRHSNPVSPTFFLQTQQRVRFFWMRRPVASTAGASVSGSPTVDASPASDRAASGTPPTGGTTEVGGADDSEGLARTEDTGAGAATAVRREQVRYGRQYAPGVGAHEPHATRAAQSA